MTNSLRAGLEAFVEVLTENNTSPGITASQLAKKTRMTRKSAMNRVSELRTAGLRIFSNQKRNTTYYRIAA